jgi:uncharacterized protein
MIRCPICERQFEPAASPAMPFCSERCRQIDLGRWLDEKHGLPAEPAEGDDLEDSPYERSPPADDE